MRYPMNLSLDDCINDKKGAKAGIDNLMGMTMSEYFKECREEYTLLSRAVTHYFPPHEFTDFPNLYLADYVIQEFRPTDLSSELLYAPIKKQAFNHEAFAFSLGAFLDIVDEHLPDDANDTRKRFRKNWKCYMDYSINRVIKNLFQSEQQTREQLLGCFTNHFLGSLWEINEINAIDYL